MRFLAAVTVIGIVCASPVLANADILTPLEKQKLKDFENAKETGVKPVSLDVKEFKIETTKTAEFKNVCRIDHKGPSASNGSIKTYQFKKGVIKQYICGAYGYDQKTKKISNIDGYFSEIRLAVKGYKHFTIKGRNSGDIAIANDMLYIESHGCCGEGVYLTTYDLKTGKTVDKDVLIHPFINEIEDRSAAK